MSLNSPYKFNTEAGSGRRNEKVKLGVEDVGVFSNEDSRIRLVVAMYFKQNDEQRIQHCFL